MLLQYAEQPDLEVQGHLADLVEEDRAAVGQFEHAAAGTGRAGERAFLVAEQLAFKERLGKSPTVDRDERSLGSSPFAVDRHRQPFFANTGFAEDEERRVARHDPADGLHEGLHCRAIGHEVAESRFRQRLAGQQAFRGPRVALLDHGFEDFAEAARRQAGVEHGAAPRREQVRLLLRIFAGRHNDHVGGVRQFPERLDRLHRRTGNEIAADDDQVGVLVGHGLPQEFAFLNRVHDHVRASKQRAKLPLEPVGFDRQDRSGKHGKPSILPIGVYNSDIIGSQEPACQQICVRPREH